MLLFPFFFVAAEFSVKFKRFYYRYPQLKPDRGEYGETKLYRKKKINRCEWVQPQSSQSSMIKRHQNFRMWFWRIGPLVTSPFISKAKLWVHGFHSKLQICSRKDFLNLSTFIGMRIVVGFFHIPASTLSRDEVD